MAWSEFPARKKEFARRARATMVAVARPRDLPLLREPLRLGDERLEPYLLGPDAGLPRGLGRLFPLLRGRKQVELLPLRLRLLDGRLVVADGVEVALVLVVEVAEGHLDLEGLRLRGQLGLHLVDLLEQLAARLLAGDLGMSGGKPLGLGVAVVLGWQGGDRGWHGRWHRRRRHRLGRHARRRAGDGPGRGRGAQGVLALAARQGEEGGEGDCLGGTHRRAY
jgi:hypothetical protein